MCAVFVASRKKQCVFRYEATQVSDHRTRAHYSITMKRHYVLINMQFARIKKVGNEFVELDLSTDGVRNSRGLTDSGLRN